MAEGVRPEDYCDEPAEDEFGEIIKCRSGRKPQHPLPVCVCVKERSFLYITDTQFERSWAHYYGSMWKSVHVYVRIHFFCKHLLDSKYIWSRLLLFRHHWQFIVFIIPVSKNVPNIFVSENNNYLSNKSVCFLKRRVRPVVAFIKSKNSSCLRPLSCCCMSEWSHLVTASQVRQKPDLSLLWCSCTANLRAGTIRIFSHTCAY